VRQTDGGHRRHGETRRDKARPGQSLQAWLGGAGLVASTRTTQARRGQTTRGRARLRMAGHRRQGAARLYVAWRNKDSQARRGWTRRGEAWRGEAPLARQGVARQGLDRLGGQLAAGMVWLDAASHGLARQDEDSQAWPGRTWRDPAPLGRTPQAARIWASLDAARLRGRGNSRQAELG